MRLGGFFGAASIAELEPLCQKLDCYGLSAIFAPSNLAELPDDECAAFGARARELNIVIGEVFFGENLLTSDGETRARRIECVRAMLRKADAMGCLSVVTTVGSKDPSDSIVVPHPYLFTDECKAEFREIVLRIMDGLDLKITKYVIEPWFNTFFYQPEDIREFLDSVDHPAVGLHLDQMNMVGQRYFFRTTELINTTFELLADRAWAVHLKDIRWDPQYDGLKWDTVHIGDGVLDYETYLRRLAELPADTPCYCEHMTEERDYALNFARLHFLAEKVGVRFIRRVE